MRAALAGEDGAAIHRDERAARPALALRCALRAQHREVGRVVHLKGVEREHIVNKQHMKNTHVAFQLTYLRNILVHYLCNRTHVLCMSNMRGFEYSHIIFVLVYDICTRYFYGLTRNGRERCIRVIRGL